MQRKIDWKKVEALTKGKDLRLLVPYNMPGYFAGYDVFDKLAEFIKELKEGK